MNQREIIHIGAYLHDIGKLLYRAQKTKSGDTHENLGEKFIREYIAKGNLLEENVDEIINVANRQPEFIKRADKDAASERLKETSKETRRPLISIFSKIFSSLQNEDYAKVYFNYNIYYYEPDYLTNKLQIPTKVENVKDTESWTVNEEIFIEKHRILLESFKEELSKLKHFKYYKTFFTSFDKLCEKYLCYVSSASYKSLPDISLYDHSKLVSALSICYYDSDSRDNTDCILLNSDISGIQNFIYYDIEKAKSAAKQLRGRSFYLIILTEAICKFLINEFELYETNVLFNGGGNFTLLIPNNQKNREKITKLEKEINQFLFDNFDTRLQVVISYIETSGDKLSSNFSQEYEKLQNKINRAKNQKSLSILDRIFYSNQIINFNEYEEKFIKLGEILTKINNDYLVEIYSESNPFKEEKESLMSFPKLNLYYKIISTTDNENSIDSLEKELYLLNKNKVKSIICYKINNTDFISTNNKINLGLEIPIGYSFKLIANYIPTNSDGKPLNFEELSKLEGQLNTLSYPYLGLLRMDVDNLGMIFKNGFISIDNIPFNEKNYSTKSISRVSTLSRLLTNFFSIKINEIAEQKQIYIVYSGGDDLFAVGSWYNIIEFSREVNKQFKTYCCKNPFITLSAGTLFINHNYPISKAAKLCGENESKAKSKNISYRINGYLPIKNNISIFDREVSWEEYERLLNIALGINHILEKDYSENEYTISRSFLYQLLKITKNVFDRKGNFLIDNVHKFNSKLHYHFARRKVDSVELEESKLKFKTDLAKMFLNSNIEEKKNWYYNFQIPASYVLLKTRIKQ